jgi:hypothetical protein
MRTATFLFTDMEASTRLLEQLGQSARSGILSRTQLRRRKRPGRGARRVQAARYLPNQATIRR